MRTMNLLATLGLLATPAFAKTAAPATAGVFADVEVKITDAALTKKGAGVHTLFITLYDEASAAPMPYGALKVELTKDATGTIYKGKLDSTNVMVMGGGGTPKTLRLKAKLDKDGSAGPDSAGDLVGIAKGVAAGSKVTITIDQAI